MQKSGVSEKVHLLFRTKKRKNSQFRKKKFAKPAFVALTVHLALMSTKMGFTTKRKRKQLQILLST